MFQRMICYLLSVAACLVLLSTHVATAQESKEGPIATVQDDAADVSVQTTDHGRRSCV